MPHTQEVVAAALAAAPTTQSPTAPNGSAPINGALTVDCPEAGCLLLAPGGHAHEGPHLYGDTEAEAENLAYELDEFGGNMLPSVRERKERRLAALRRPTPAYDPATVVEGVFSASDMVHALIALRDRAGRAYDSIPEPTHHVTVTAMARIEALQSAVDMLTGPDLDDLIRQYDNDYR